MPSFMDTSVRNFTKNLSKKEIYKVFGKTMGLLESEEQKEINNTKTKELDNLSLLIADEDDSKELTLKKELTKIQRNNAETFKN